MGKKTNREATKKKKGSKWQFVVIFFGVIFISFCIGIAGGKGVGLLIKKGNVIKKVPEDQLLQTLKDELDNWI